MLNSINRNEKFHGFLSKEKIRKFNFSRTPWWVGQYERLIRLTKWSLFKSIGKSLLTWSELEEALLHDERNLNNWLLTYIEEDLEYSVLIPKSMILGRDIKLPDDSPEKEKFSDNWKKWQRCVHKCKEAAWKIWVHEYLAALRERALLKDQFSSCIQWSYTVTQRKLPATLKITKHWKLMLKNSNQKGQQL